MRTEPKKTTVGVRYRRTLSKSFRGKRSAATVMTTNNSPIKVAAAVEVARWKFAPPVKRQFLHGGSFPDAACKRANGP